MQCSGCSEGVALPSVSLFKNRVLASCWEETIKQMTVLPRADFERDVGLSCKLLVQRTFVLSFVASLLLAVLVSCLERSL